MLQPFGPLRQGGYQFFIGQTGRDFNFFCFPTEALLERIVRERALRIRVAAPIPLLDEVIDLDGVSGFRGFRRLSSSLLESRLPCLGKVYLRIESNVDRLLHGDFAGAVEQLCHHLSALVPGRLLARIVEVRIG